MDDPQEIRWDCRPCLPLSRSPVGMPLDRGAYLLDVLPGRIDFLGTRKLSSLVILNLDAQ
jgi:hypothetical protein